MSDRNSTNRLTLGAALRALPLAAPERDAWSDLAAQLRPAAKPAGRRFVISLAIAASCILAVLAAYSLQRRANVIPTQFVATLTPDAASSNRNIANTADPTNATSTQNTDAASKAQLAALQLRSQALEEWLRDTRIAASPLPGQDLAAASEIENIIGLIDVGLVASSHTDTLPLWKRRVALLEDLTALRYSNYRMAETALADAPNRIN
jgi:hypothetical protein